MYDSTSKPSIAGAIPAPRRVVVRPVIVVCECGQDLDVGGGTYCPRCGINLRHAPSLAPSLAPVA